MAKVLRSKFIKLSFLCIYCLMIFSIMRFGYKSWFEQERNAAIPALFELKQICDGEKRYFETNGRFIGYNDEYIMNWGLGINVINMQEFYYIVRVIEPGLSFEAVARRKLGPYKGTELVVTEKGIIEGTYPFKPSEKRIAHIEDNTFRMVHDKEYKK